MLGRKIKSAPKTEKPAILEFFLDCGLFKESQLSGTALMIVNTLFNTVFKGFSSHSRQIPDRIAIFDIIKFSFHPQ